MAVYQGARRRAPLPLGLDALPGVRLDGRAREDGATQAGLRTRDGHRGRDLTIRKPKRASRERSRPSSVGIAIAAIVIVFSAAFLSLSQSVRVAATGYDIVRLVSEHDRLNAIRQDLQADVERLKSEPAIRKQAFDNGLGQLGAPIILPAR